MSLTASPSLPRTLEILLVEDNPGDVRLTGEALRVSDVPCHLQVEADGVEAMSFLHQAGYRGGKPLPDLVILDLNLPRKSGREVLADIRADPVLRKIPVVVLSTSMSDTDVAACYDLGANCYIGKPMDFDSFIAAVKGAVEFWARVASLPISLPR